MQSLTLDESRTVITAAGVLVVKHLTPYGGFYYELEVSGATQRLTGWRPQSGERVFDLVKILMAIAEGASPQSTTHWILWLHARVYTNDEFTLTLLDTLVPSSEKGPAGFVEGYRFEASEINLCMMVVAIIVLAEWDLFLVPSHGLAAVTFEHDGLMFCDRLMDGTKQNSDQESQLVKQFAFSRITA